MGKTLQTKIVLTLVLVLFSVLGVNFVLTSNIFRAEYTHAAEAEALAVGQSLRAQVERLMEYGLLIEDLVGFDELCADTVTKNPNVAYAKVVDVNGTVLFHSDNTQRRRVVDEPELYRAVGGGVERVVQYTANGKEMYGVVIPVLNSADRLVGAVVLGFPEENIARKVSDLTGRIVTLSFLLFAFALALIAVLFSMWVSKPLAKLQRATEEIVARGTAAFRPVDIDSRDEIGRLAASFNAMAVELQKTTVSKAKLEEAFHQLRKMQAQLIQQEKLAGIGQLAAGVAHEINNPVAIIISNLESLRQYVARMTKVLGMQEDVIAQMAREDEQMEALSTLVEAKKAAKIDYVVADTEELIKETLDGATRVKNIVQDLRGFVRAEHENRLANINDGIESTVNILANKIRYRTPISKDLGDIPPIVCNLGQLNQVFMNILVNAAQAVESAGEIRIKTWADKANIYVEIADTGPGISPTVINRIFEPFFTTKEVGQGAGLGLSVSYDIVKKHGGEIRVKSDAGKGTTVTVVLPVNRNRNEA
jgi:signal transduction histidine kinase